MENYTRLFGIAGFFVLVTAASALLIMDETRERPYRATFPGTDAPELRLEVADKYEERRKGLMHRHTLEEETGMLFIFPGERDRSFWMKNTFIPLDIIFADSNGTIVKIHEAEPQPFTGEKNLRRYRSGTPAKYVIETRQGFSRKHGIEEGDTVLLRKKD